MTRASHGPAITELFPAEGLSYLTATLRGNVAHAALLYHAKSRSPPGGISSRMLAVDRRAGQAMLPTCHTAVLTSTSPQQREHNGSDKYERERPQDPFCRA